MSDTIRDVLDRALDAYATLTELGEDVEDEWTYVNDLSAAWRDRLDAAATDRGTDTAPSAVGVAVDRAIDEIGRIADPHRAIDWLSTFPQIVLLAIGEQPGGSRTQRAMRAPASTRGSRQTRRWPVPPSSLSMRHSPSGSSPAP